jgi:type III secretory pathway lipoprotein EscJ
MDVEIVKSFLESAGIACFLQDEIINRAYFANVNGGVKLLVREENLDEAIQILMDAGYLKQEDLEPSTEFGWVNKLLNKFRKKSN